MAEAREHWENVGQEFGDLGRRLKGAWPGTAPADAAPEAPAEAPPEPAAAAEEATGGAADAGDKKPRTTEQVKGALRSLASSLDQTFTAVGTAVNDEEVRAKTKDTAKALGDALGATFDQVGEEISKRLPGKRNDPPSSPSA